MIPAAQSRSIWAVESRWASLYVEWHGLMQFLSEDGMLVLSRTFDAYTSTWSAS
jgi:hypothetical protein